MYSLGYIGQHAAVGHEVSEVSQDAAVGHTVDEVGQQSVVSHEVSLCKVGESDHILCNISWVQMFCNIKNTAMSHCLPLELV